MLIPNVSIHSGLNPPPQALVPKNMVIHFIKKCLSSWCMELYLPVSPFISIISPKSKLQKTKINTPRSKIKAPKSINFEKNHHHPPRDVCGFFKGESKGHNFYKMLCQQIYIQGFEMYTDSAWFRRNASKPDVLFTVLSKCLTSTTYIF